MRSLRRFFIALGLLLSLVLGAAQPALAQLPAKGAVSADDMVLGDPKAKVTVIEYASLSCPHCAQWNKDVWPAFKAKYVDTGKVRYVFREFITAPPQIAAAGSLLARCAGKDKYFSVIDAMFKAQPEIYRTSDLKTPLTAIAGKAGLSEAQMTACVTDDKALEALNNRVQHWVEVEDIQATPTFDINGLKLQGEQPMDKLDAAINAAQSGK